MPGKREFEISLQIFNACAGSGRPETYFEEAELDAPEDYLKMKHGKDFENMKREVLSSGDIEYTLDKGSTKYKYTFTEY